MENQYERFFKLLHSLLGLVMSGARKVDWLNGKLQTIVDTPQPHKVFGMTVEEYWEAVGKLSKEYPINRGEQIMEVIGHFCKTKAGWFFPSLQLDENILAEEVYKALFWLGTAGIKVVHEVPTESSSFHWLRATLNNWMLSELGYNFYQQSKTTQIQFPLKFKSPEILFRAIDHLRATVQKVALVEPVELEGPSQNTGQLALLVEMEDMITAAAWFKVIGYERADAMQGLLNLYLKGNYPVGIDTRDNKVLVYCRRPD